MRSLVGETVLESLGFAGIAVGVGAAAVLLLSPKGRREAGKWAAYWATKIRREVADVLDEAKGRRTLVVGAAAVAAAGATILAAPEGAAIAAATAPAAASTVPLVLEGLDRAVEAEQLVGSVLGKEKDKDKDQDENEQ